MCMSVTVTVSGLDRRGAEALVAELEGSGGSLLRIQLARLPWLGTSDARLWLSEDGACACSLLADDADWNATAWSMHPELAEKLASTLRTIADKARAALVVEALWAGDVAEQSATVTAEEMFDLARGQLLGPKTRYNVSAAS